MSDQQASFQALLRAGAQHFQRGEIAKAEEIWRRELPQLETPAHRAALFGNIAQCRAMQGDMQQARALLGQSVDLYRSIDDRQNVARTQLIAADLCTRVGDDGQAASSFEEALVVLRELKDARGIASAVSGLGLIALRRGDFAVAEARLEEARSIHEATNDGLGKTHAWLSLAGLRSAQAAYLDAALAYQRAEVLAREHAPLLLGDILTGRAVVAENLGNTPEALASYREALEVYRKNVDPRGEAAVHHNLGAVHLRNRAPDDAVRELEQARLLLEKIGDRLSATHVLSNLATADWLKGRYREAHDKYVEASESYERLGASGYAKSLLTNIAAAKVGISDFEGAQALVQRVLVDTRESHDRASEANILNISGWIFLSAGEVERSLSTLETSCRLVETVRDAVSHDMERVSVQGVLPPAHDNLAAARVAHGDNRGAWRALERGRTRALTSILDARSRGFAPALGSLYEQPNVDRTEATPLPEVADLEDVQSLLTDDVTLLQLHHVGSRFVGGVHREDLWIFVITRNSFELVSVPVRQAELQDHISRLEALVTRNAGLRKSLTKASRTLYDTLIAPVEDRLGTPTLVIVPSGRLFRVPFAALIDERKRPVIERFDVALLPSAGALRYLRSPATRIDSALTVGDPAPSDPKLAMTAQECHDIAARFPHTPLLGAQATIENVRRALIPTPRPKVVHFACHAQFDSASPLASRLRLAPSDGDDGAWTADQLARHDWQGVEFAVLSACESGRGHRAAGEELLGLTRAFFVAGARGVLCTAWPVSDDGTRQLMASFYARLSSGETPVRALGESQRELLRSREYDHPYYWAPYMFWGAQWA